MFSINCLTGMFNQSTECFAEAFHRHPQGAVGIIAASEVSYSFVNDTYVWGMYDYMWPDFDPGYGVTGPHDMKPAFASASGKYYLEASSWPYNSGSKTVTYHLFHHHGDAFMTVHTEMPQTLVVSHDPVLLSGLDHFFVTADAGALIGISAGGELLGAATGTGMPLNVTIPAQMPGNDIQVTVTKQNHYRYSQAVSVIPPAGAYVVYETHTINDSGGNGNGLLDYDEDVLLSLTLENVGLQTSVDLMATIMTDDPYVTISDSTASYGDLPAGATATAVDDYRLAVDGLVPDGRLIPFSVVAADTDTLYTSHFTIVAHAPDVLVESHLVLDGDNHILDPGETADLQVTLRNDGSAAVMALEVTLTSLGAYVTVTSGSFTIPVLPGGAATSGTFTLAADAATPVGHVAEFALDAAASNYAISDNLALTIGLAIEDFESGYFASYPWDMAGTADWVIDTSDVYEGVYSAKSGQIGDYETSELFVPVEVVGPGTISFYYMVSSDYSDYLRFFIDGVEQDSWSGTVGWNQASYSVTPGQHTFAWKYTKDSYYSSGSDCAWIDYIVFPPLGALLFPDIDVAPQYFSAYLFPGEASTQTLRIGNTGVGVLNFDLSEDPEAP